MNALVLGGCGFIGSHLVDRLIAAGDRVRVMDRQPELFRGPVSGVEYLLGDLGNRAYLHGILSGCDVVYHLISTTVPRTSNEDPAFDVMSNVVETLHLLDHCVKEGVKKVVLLSSGGAVYGTPDALPVAEDAPTNPSSSYGIAKLTLEKYLGLYWRLHGLDFAIVRPSNLYGPRQNPLGAQGIVAVAMARIAAGLPVEVWGNGEAVKDYVYVDDVVEGIRLAATYERPASVFNLGSGHGLSVNGLLRLIGETSGRAVTVSYTPRLRHDVEQIVLDISRARQQLGWEPTTPLADGLVRTWAFISSCSTLANRLR